MTLMLLFVLTQGSDAPVHCATSLFQSQMVEAARTYCKPSAKREQVAPEVGDKKVFWLYNMTVMPPSQYQASATCRASGSHCYIFVEDSVWQTGTMDSTMVLRILERFERSSPSNPSKGVWQHNTGLFGQPPDEIDNDSLIYVLYYNVGTFHGIQFDGFWMFYDEYYDSVSYPRWGYHSNEVEVVYIDCYPYDPSGDYRISIVAHEFEHMIHWNYDQDEELWVNEGCAELAMLVYGVPDDISGFNSNPDNDLTLWTGTWSDYIKVYLWSLYLYEQYGEYRRGNLIRNLVDVTENGIAGVDSAFIRCSYPERFSGVFDDWVVCNYFDDTVSYQGKYGYYETNLPPFANSGLHSVYPVNNSGVVTRWAADYIRFRPPGKAFLDVRFDGNNSASFAVQTIKVDTLAATKVVERMTLDSLQNGSRRLFDFGNIYHYAMMVIANHTLVEGSQDYVYQADLVGIGEEARSLKAEARFELAINPNPFGKKTDIRFEMPEARSQKQEVRLKILDISGRVVRSFDVSSIVARPSSFVTWDGRDSHGSQVVPGVYFVELSCGGLSRMCKCVLTRR